MNEKIKMKIINKPKLCPICKLNYVFFCDRCYYKVFIKRNVKNSAFHCILDEMIQKILHVILFYHSALNVFKDSVFKSKMIKEICTRTIIAYIPNDLTQIFDTLHPQITSNKEGAGNNDPHKLHKSSSMIDNTASSTFPDSMLQLSELNSSSIKSKKSSNILSAIVKKARRKSKSDCGAKSGHTSNVDDQSNTSVELPDDEVVLSVENYEKKYEDIVEAAERNEQFNTTDSEHSNASSHRLSFFRKFIKKQSSFDVAKKSSSHEVKCSHKERHVKHNYKLEKVRNASSHEIITTFMNFERATLSVTLVTGLQIVQDITANLKENETHLVQILTKHIKDENLQKDLLDTLVNHSKLQWDAERRANALANDMWMHQIDIGRAQERTIQDTFNSVMKHNRQLQIDNEIIFRKNEKLVKKIRDCHDTSSKNKCADCEIQINQLLKHNEKLQEKLEKYIHQLESLEAEIHIVHKQNDGLEEQTRTASSQIQNLKAIILRAKTDYELEIAALEHNLQIREKTINDVVEAGDVLLEDLDGIKRQFKNIQWSINWSKYKFRGNCISDLVHMCRSCINEFCKNLVTAHTEISLKDKDIETLKDNNNRLQENLQKAATELETCTKKMEEFTQREAETVVLEQRCKYLENDLLSINEKIDRHQSEFHVEKETLLKKIAMYEAMNNELTAKDKIADQTKLVITNLASENYYLRSQIDELNQLLIEAGAGDIFAKDQQMAFFHDQYCEVVDEKNELQKKIQKLTEDNKNLAEEQNKNYKHILELEQIDKNNTVVKQQLEAEKQTVATLQNERKKYLEEQNSFKTIIQHMKNEISRAQKLEGTVMNITKEANRLASIADYNKKVGEKLKNEVLERDNTILQLKHSVEELHQQYIKSSKEKKSLSNELSEVSNIKDELSKVLSVEVQRNVELGNLKKEVLVNANNQIQKYEEIQKSERTVLAELLCEFKGVVAQRDALAKTVDNNNLEIIQYKSQINELTQKFNQSLATLNNKEMNLLHSLTKEKTLVESLRKSLDEMKYTTELVRREKEDSESSVKYLQNNIQKLHKDINIARKDEKETFDKLKEANIFKDSLQRELNSLNSDNEKLKLEIESLNNICEQTLTDFEKSIKASVDKEKATKGEIDHVKKLLNEQKEQTAHLKQNHELIQQENTILKEEKDKLLRKNQKNYNVIAELQQKIQSLMEADEEKSQMELNLNDLLANHEDLKVQLNYAHNQLEEQQNQLNKLLVEKENNRMKFDKHVKELLENYEALKEETKSLRETSLKLDNERAAYATLSQIHKEVTAKYLASIKQLVDEKNRRQEVASQLRESTQATEALEREKEMLKNQIDSLRNQLNIDTARIHTLTHEKVHVETSLSALENKYIDLHSQYMITESKEQHNLLESQLSESHEMISNMKDDIFRLLQEIKTLEFEKSELTLKLHETQGKLTTQENLCEQFKNTNKLILAAILQMKEDGKVDSVDVNHLLHMAYSESDTSINI